MPIIQKDEKFTKAPPALFGMEFATTAKEHVDQVKALRSTLGARGSSQGKPPFWKAPPHSHMGRGGGGSTEGRLTSTGQEGVEPPTKGKEAKGTSTSTRSSNTEKGRTAVLSPVLSPVYPIKSLHSTKDQISCMGVVPISANNRQLAGRLAHHILNWGALTRDCWVLNTVQGYQIEFEAEPHQNRQPYPSHYVVKNSNQFFTIPIHTSQREYLRFKFQDKVYQFNCLPFGLSVAPWVFTKTLRPAIALLRELGERLIAYIDDILILAESKEEKWT